MLKISVWRNVKLCKYSDRSVVKFYKFTAEFSGMHVNWYQCKTSAIHMCTLCMHVHVIIFYPNPSSFFTLQY